MYGNGGKNVYSLKDSFLFLKLRHHRHIAMTDFQRGTEQHYYYVY